MKARSVRSKEPAQFTSSAQSLEDIMSKSAGGIGSAVSFSDDEDTAPFSSSKSTARGKKGSSIPFRSSHDAPEVGKTSSRGRGRWRGRGRGSSNLKQTTLDAAIGFRQSQRSASAAATASVQSIADDEDNVDSGSSDETAKNALDEVNDSSDNDGSVRGKGRKRAAPRGRGRGSTTSKRGRKSDNASSSIHKMLASKDDEDDDDDDDDMPRRVNKSQTRVTRNYGALRR